tara:strand:- start:176 stop:751 length:576 start_codon:yes stop_codon:yes gene_type:complete
MNKKLSFLDLFQFIKVSTLKNSNFFFIVFISIFNVSCNPQFNWREISGKDYPYKILMPGKTSNFTRSVKINNQNLKMNMIGTKINGISFTVASAKLGNRNLVKSTLDAMQITMVNNISGKIISKKIGKLNCGNEMTEITAKGFIGKSKEPTLLLGRFTKKQNYVIQAIILGPKNKINQEVSENFLLSFSTQ